MHVIKREIMVLFPFCARKNKRNDLILQEFISIYRIEAHLFEYNRAYYKWQIRCFSYRRLNIKKIVQMPKKYLLLYSITVHIIMNMAYTITRDK